LSIACSGEQIVQQDDDFVLLGDDGAMLFVAEPIELLLHGEDLDLGAQIDLRIVRGSDAVLFRCRFWLILITGA